MNETKDIAVNRIVFLRLYDDGTLLINYTHNRDTQKLSLSTRNKPGVIVRRFAESLAELNGLDPFEDDANREDVILSYTVGDRTRKLHGWE